MTHKVHLETEFIVPDDMDEENVKHVLDQFFGDLIRTDRFLDARIVEESGLDEAERARLIEMMEKVDGEDLDRLERFVTAYTDD